MLKSVFVFDVNVWLEEYEVEIIYYLHRKWNNNKNKQGCGLIMEWTIVNYFTMDSKTSQDVDKNRV